MAHLAPRLVQLIVLVEVNLLIVILVLAVEDLQKYFDDNYNYLPNAMNTFRFAHCMIIYRLEDYQAEVERIVKKYCKECE